MKGQGKPRVVKNVRSAPVKQTKVPQKPYKPAQGVVRG